MRAAQRSCESKEYAFWGAEVKADMNRTEPGDVGADALVPWKEATAGGAILAG